MTESPRAISFLKLDYDRTNLRQSPTVMTWQDVETILLIQISTH